MGTLLSIYLESCADPNVMMQQVTQRMDNAGQDPCGAHRWAPESSQVAHSSGPTCEFVASPEAGPGASIGTLQLGYPLLLCQDSHSYP